VKVKFFSYNYKKAMDYRCDTWFRFDITTQRPRLEQRSRSWLSIELIVYNRMLDISITKRFKEGANLKEVLG